MKIYEIGPATPEIGEQLASNMRDEDAAEVWAAARLSPREAVVQSIQRSRDTSAALCNGRPFCVWGVASPTILSRIGIPWALTSKNLEEHTYTFLKGSVEVVENWRRRFDYLTNYVDCRHTKSIEWLDWLGFDLGKPEPFGYDKLPFRRFEMKRR